MSNKNIFAIIIIAVSGLFLFSFILPFKAAVVDPVVDQTTNLETAYAQATQQLSLKTLRAKKQQLGEEEINFLRNFVPNKLHSGQFVYNLGQLANQKRLTVKGIQYTVLNDTAVSATPSEKRLLVELTLDGKYEDFNEWLKTIERSDVLIDIESFRGSKVSNNSDIITFQVKMYSYGTNID